MDNAPFKANLDELRDILDGELDCAIKRLHTVRSDLHDVRDPWDWVRPDIPAGLESPFAVSLGELITAYKAEFDVLINQLRLLSSELRQVVDLHGDAQDAVPSAECP